MRLSSGLTTAEILAVFTDEIVARRGRVSDTFNDGRRLFTRSVLSPVEDVRPGDGVQGGVALKATETEIWLFPYLFRLVCRNGAIIAQALESRFLVELNIQEPEAARQCIREGVAECCAEEVFSKTVRGMRAACQTEVDLALTFLPMLSRVSGSRGVGPFSQIMDRFLREGDQSRFALANAVTAVARDIQDPSLRWNLEELGGAVIMGEAPKHPVADGRLVMAS
jgi:hypothetical protein